MLSLMSKAVAMCLVSASTLWNPTTPDNLSFNASASVLSSSQIRIAVQKATEKPVVVLLKNEKKDVIFCKTLRKHESTFAVKLDVSELADGTYELEVKSKEGSIYKQFTLTSPVREQASRLVSIL